MESLGEKNQTAVTEFILLGYGSVPDTQVLPFVVFLLIYMGTVLENTVMVLIIRINPCLHTPMYFFLMNLSLLDLSYSSTIAPKAMATFLRGSKAISYNGCAAQLFFFALFVTTEAFILAAMAYDRYTAICDPLLYPVTMSKRVCVQLLVGSYICGGTNYLVQTSFTFTLSYCGPKEINHFFCDGPPLLNLSCTNMYSSELVLFILSGFITVITSGIILISYAYIIYAILRICSAKGRSRTLSTCSSHMLVVTLFFGKLSFMYTQPGSLSSSNQTKVVSVFYTLVIPTLNPFIYSLRNKDVKNALWRNIGRKITSK